VWTWYGCLYRIDTVGSLWESLLFDLVGSSRNARSLSSRWICAADEGVKLFGDCEGCTKDDTNPSRNPVSTGLFVGKLGVLILKTTSRILHAGFCVTKRILTLDCFVKPSFDINYPDSSMSMNVGASCVGRSSRQSSARCCVNPASCPGNDCWEIHNILRRITVIVYYSKHLFYERTPKQAHATSFEGTNYIHYG
jgi:hypothetical protein